MKKYRFLLYFILAFQFFFLAFLAGCVSTAPGAAQAVHNEHPLEAQLKTQKPKNISFLPEAPDIKNLPELSDKELEQSADIMFQRGNLPMALVDYEKCLTNDPENLDVRYKKGLVLLAANMTQDAIKEFERILEANKSFALAYEGLGKAYFQMKQQPEAEKHFQKALEMDPSLWKSHNFLGMIYDYNRRYDEAVPNYLASIRLKPDSGVLYHNLGVSYYLAGHYQNAIESFQEAIARHYSDPKTYNTLALAYAKAGKYLEAINAFTKGGDKAKAYNNLGCFFLAEKKYKEAINCFEKALEISPEFYAKANENLKTAQIAYHRDE